MTLSDRQAARRIRMQASMLRNRFYRHLLTCFLLGALAACTTLSQQPNASRQASYAFDRPEHTDLGRTYRAAARRHQELSGFYVLNQGMDGFDARAQLIDKAQASLDLQYFIFRQDETGALLTERLIRAADRGVRIRVLVDDINSKRGDEQLLTLAAHRNIQVRVFNPFTYRGHDDSVRLSELLVKKSQLNYRMHNKLFVADNAVALIGGRNIGDEYFQVDPEYEFEDVDLFTVGPVVKLLSRSFDEYWNSNYAVPAQGIDPGHASRQAFNEYRKRLSEVRKILERRKESSASRIYRNRIMPGLFASAPPLTWAAAQLVYDTPHKKDAVEDGQAGSLIYTRVAEVVNATRQEWLMVTPYLVPGEEGMQLFQTLQERHVLMRVLTNSLESNPETMAHAGYSHYRIPLLKLGVQLYEVRARPRKAAGSGANGKLARYANYRLHTKLYVFDRERIFLGSMNFDQRSMYLNTEIGLIIDSPVLARQAAERFAHLTDLTNSYQVLLKTDASGKSETLAWLTLLNGKRTELTTEPSENVGQRIQKNLMSILPFDDEL